MQLLQPELEKIQRKYKGRKDQASQMRQSAEIQNLYKKHNVSMFGFICNIFNFTDYVCYVASSTKN